MDQETFWTTSEEPAADNCTSGRVGGTLSGCVYLADIPLSADDILAPAYLTFDLNDAGERRMMGAYTFAGLEGRFGRFVEPGAHESAYRIVLAGHDFGRGSARPHSAVALYESGVRVILARSFYEPFRRVAVGEGLLLPLVLVRPIEGEFNRLRTGDEVAVDFLRGRLLVRQSPAEAPQAGSSAVENTIVCVAVLEPAGAMLDILKAGGLKRR